MDRLEIATDINTFSKILDYAESGRQRKIIRLFYINKMTVGEIVIQTGYKKSVVISELVFINKMIEDNIPSKICKQCQKPFYTLNTRLHTCVSCKTENAKRASIIQKEYTKSLKNEIKRKSKKENEEVKTIFQIEREREEYNKKHGTQLSYGYYILKVGADGGN